MTRDEWAALYDNDQVREIFEYMVWLQQYRNHRFLAQSAIEVLRAGKSRVEQLRRYAEKKRDPAATFRPYAPLKGSETTRVEVKRRAAAEGISSQTVRVCGHEGLDGRKCWLPPHNPDVAHKF